MSYIGNAPISAAFLTDTFSGTGSQTAFTMTVAPANTSSIIVAVTGVLQDPSTYSVSGTTLTFSAAPPSGTSNISVRYLGIPASGVTTTAYRTVTEFTATSGQTSFSVPSYTVGYIDVYRNGVMLGTADFTATTGTTVVLATGATTGDLIRTESFYVSSVLNAIPATAGAVNSTYLTDASVTTSKIADANVTQAKLATGVAGNGPAFSANRAADQSITQNAYTQIQWTAETFDTGGCFNNTGSTVTLNGISAPAYTFAPNVAGYYLFFASCYNNPAGSGQYVTAIRKNGSNQAPAGNLVNTAVGGGSTVSATNLLYANGTSDYFDVVVYASTASPTVQSGSTFFGYMVRSA